MRDAIPIRRALISVSDKSYLLELVSSLYKVNPDLDILSSGGTYRVITGKERKAEEQAYPNFPAREVSAYTGFPESPDGLLKTLHPGVHGGILLNPEVPTHASYMSDNGQMQILPIELVVVNLYPFNKMVEDGAELERLRAHGIDIGGPAMVNAAAKSFPHVAVVTDPYSFDVFMEHFKIDGTTNLATRFRLATRAFDLTSSFYAGVRDHLRTLDPEQTAEYYRGLKVVD